MGMETGGVNEQFADVMRQQIPALFEYHPCFENVEAWTNRHTMLAVAHIMIVARSFGVDSCPMEGFVTTQVKEAFQIPAEVDVCCLVPLGYAAEPFKPYGGRFGIDQVCFGESYGERFEV
jgi:nitroreductase